MTVRNTSDTISVFPLNTVLFPSSEIRLHIFEDRYKDMFKEVLEGDKTFGVVHSDNEFEGIAQIGCLAKVEEVLKFPDGRMNIVSTGVSRFKILDIAQTEPHMVAKVEMLAEDDVTGKAILLSQELRTLIDEVLTLSAKVYDRAKPEEESIPNDPVSLSYLVPAEYYGSLFEQQRMLATTSTEERLIEEISLISQARNHLAALSSLKNAVG